MRYTKYNPDLGCWEVPCLRKMDGSAITFKVRVDPGDCFYDGYDGYGVMTHQEPGLTYVLGEVIDRLAELENLIEANPSLAEYDARDIKEADRENL